MTNDEMISKAESDETLDWLHTFSHARTSPGTMRKSGCGSGALKALVNMVMSCNTAAPAAKDSGIAHKLAKQAGLNLPRTRRRRSNSTAWSAPASATWTNPASLS